MAHAQQHSDSHLYRVQDAIDYIRAGEVTSAQDVIASILRLDPENASAWAVLAHLAYHPEHPQEAIFCLKQVLRIDPGDVESRAFLSRIGTGMGAAPPDSSPPLPEPLFESWHNRPTIIVESPEPPGPTLREEIQQAIGRASEVVDGVSERARGLVTTLQEMPSPAERIKEVAAHPGRQTVQVLAMINGGVAILVVLWFFVIGGPILRFMAGLGVNVQANDSGLPIIPLPIDQPTTEPSFNPASIPPTSGPTPTPVPAIATAAAAPAIIDYSAMVDDLNAYVHETAGKWDYDLGIGFADLETGQVISINGESRYHAMSTFKAPLVAYYLWLTEHGVEELPGDEDYLRRSLQHSSNPDTTCIFKRVGGIDSFNDWLNQQHLSRQHNFVFKWGDWPCVEDGLGWTPQPDYRYSRGNEELGLPGRSALLTCPNGILPCDKAFAPVELAWWYARLYDGDIISEENMRRMFAWMEPTAGGSVFFDHIPREAGAQIYIKGGGRQAGGEYNVNFIGEAGVVELDYGSFALVVFMQRNPTWPGTEVMGGAVEIVYKHFQAAHDN